MTGKSVVSVSLCLGSELRTVDVWMDGVKCGLLPAVVFSAAVDCRVETIEYLGIDCRWGISNLQIIYVLTKFFTIL